MVRRYSDEVNSSLSNQRIILVGRTSYSTVWVRSLRWRPSDPGWVTLNSDGCLKKAKGLTGGGWVMRDHMGKWLTDFSLRLGTCTVPAAALWALLHGLHIAWDKGVRNLVVEVDSLLVYNWIAS